MYQTYVQKLREYELWLERHQRRLEQAQKPLQQQQQQQQQSSSDGEQVIGVCEPTEIV